VNGQSKPNLKEYAEDDNKKITQLLEELVKWTKFKGMQEVRGILVSILDTETKRLIYHLSDGMSSPRIAKISKVHSSTVRDYWQAWAKVNIVEVHPSYKKRYRRIFSLDEVGLEIPKVLEVEEIKGMEEGEESDEQ